MPPLGASPGSLRGSEGVRLTPAILMPFEGQILADVNWM